MKVTCDVKTLLDSVRSILQELYSKCIQRHGEQVQPEMLLIPKFDLVTQGDNLLRVCATIRGIDGWINRSIDATVEEDGWIWICPALLLGTLEEFMKFDSKDITIEQKDSGLVKMRCGNVTVNEWG